MAPGHKVGPERQPHCRPHRAPRRRAQDRSHALQLDVCRVAWGCRPVSRWLTSKVLPLASGSETAQASHGGPIRERPTAGAAAGRSSPSAACPGESMGSRSLPNRRDAILRTHGKDPDGLHLHRSGTPKLPHGPRWNRTGDPILTIDARAVHAAVQHPTCPHIRPGERHCRKW
jgi:hypothetical protein